MSVIERPALRGWKRLGISGLVVGVGLLGAACDGRTSPGPAAPGTVEIKGDITRTPTAAVGTVKSLEGTGNQSSGNFSVAGAWKIVWSAAGPIEVRVISGETFENVKVLKGAAGGEELLSGNCNCYLEVTSAGPYTVTVTDLPS